jgi:hypothetical protein
VFFFNLEIYTPNVDKTSLVTLKTLSWKNYGVVSARNVSNKFLGYVFIVNVFA